MSSDSEPKFTAEEWRLITARAACDTYGHEYSHVINGGGRLVDIYCERGCGVSWTVTENDSRSSRSSTQADE